MSKRNFLIIWILMICAMVLILFLPVGRKDQPGDEVSRDEYIQYSPDAVISTMPLEEVLKSRDGYSAFTEIPCGDWEHFAFFAERAFECNGYTLLGIEGTMTYYFDEFDRLDFSCFKADLSQSDVDGLIRDLTEKYGRTDLGQGIDDTAYGQYHSEEKKYFIIAPGRDDMREREYLTVFCDKDMDLLYIYQFGWGIDPVPEGSGICVLNDLYETFLTRKQMADDRY